MFDLSKINKEWTLFLDRDGVINQERVSYVLNTGEFAFYDGVLEAMKIFDSVFYKIIVATNQRGVGRGMMTENDLLDIHAKMLRDVNASGGRIDQTYYSISMDNADINRKPNPGMAFQAFAEFPAIRKDKAIMVGNNISDMEFGKNAGLYTVLLTTTGTSVTLPHPLVDLQCNSLIEFARLLTT
jgi:histidinol-phosphate phosphatase family protein